MCICDVYINLSEIHSPRLRRIHNVMPGHAAVSLTFIIMIMIIVEIYIVRNVYYISRGIARQWPGQAGSEWTASTLSGANNASMAKRSEVKWMQE